MYTFTWIASSLKQQSMGKHAAPLGQIILILSKPVIALIPQCSTNINIIVLSLTQTGAQIHIVYHTWGKHENHSTTDVVQFKILNITSTQKLYTPYPGAAWIYIWKVHNGKIKITSLVKFRSQSAFIVNF